MKPFSLLFAAFFFSLPLNGISAMPIRVDAEQMEKRRNVPEEFPAFRVSGQEAQMEAMRHLFFLHYQPTQSMGTLWDEWIPHSVVWAAGDDAEAARVRSHLRQLLLSRKLEPDGYVSTHQHASIAHQNGWPFPFWKQGEPGATWGWHFSLQDVPGGWHATEERGQTGWTLQGGSDAGIEPIGWRVKLEEGDAWIETPPLHIDPYQSPFLQLRWMADGLADANPFVEWRKKGQQDYPVDQRFYFSAAPDQMVYAMLPVHKNPSWGGEIEQLRLRFGNPKPAEAVVQALFTQYDTRHNVNNTKFLKGSARTFAWTGDLGFLRNNIQRMRLALDYAMTQLGGLQEQLILTPWVGHEGRPGFTVHPDGSKTFHYGSGVGNNYWDLIPFGGRDAYATIHYYDALLVMADLEETIAAHPQWNIPDGPLRHEPDFLRNHAAEVKEHAGRFFWNEKTGRFVSNIDLDGNPYDYGFTFVNLEAIHYGFATDTQAQSILSWISGKRIVEGDTSQKEDIYRWRFGPRSTTLRNVDYYGWFWSGPESIPWGGQVQDGGAVLGFSYHDLSSRLRHLGPDDAWERLNEILDWFREVREQGGYREYYADGRHGTTLQGGGPPGGLGVDVEFVESILVPQVMLDFLGFKPHGDGFSLNPQLPAAWPDLTISGIRWHGMVLDVEAAPGEITISSRGSHTRPLTLRLPPGPWEVRYLDPPGTGASEVIRAEGSSPIRLGQGRMMRLRQM